MAESALSSYLSSLRFVIAESYPSMTCQMSRLDTSCIPFSHFDHGVTKSRKAEYFTYQQKWCTRWRSGSGCALLGILSGLHYNCDKAITSMLPVSMLWLKLIVRCRNEFLNTVDEVGEGRQ